MAIRLAGLAPVAMTSGTSGYPYQRDFALAHAKLANAAAR
jgi:hypothetical protein